MTDEEKVKMILEDFRMSDDGEVDIIVENLLGLRRICGRDSCGKEFTASRTDQTYCDRKCKEASRKKKRTTIRKICENCLKEFSTRRPNQRFCNHGCSVKWQKEMLGKNESYIHDPIRTNIVSLKNAAKSRARIKNIPFSITEEWIDKACQQTECPITGCVFTMGSDLPTNRSIDMLDSNIGYIDDNIRLICNWANKARNRWGDRNLIEMCGMVVRRHGGGEG